MKKENIILGIMFISLALFAIYETTNFQKNPYGLSIDSLGAAFFPKLVSVLIILLSALLIVGELKKKNKKESSSFLDSKITFPLLIGALVFIYSFLIRFLGYIISTIILNIVLLIIFKVEKKTSIIVFPVILTLLVYVIFKIAFRVPLAEGILFS